MAQKTLTVSDVVNIVCTVLAVLIAFAVVVFYITGWYYETFVNVSAIPAVSLVVG